MIRTILTLIASALLASGLHAQQPATPLTQSQVHADSVAAGETDVFTLELDAKSFVYGEVDQQSVDVAIAIYDPDGAVVRRVDGAARGAERFQFDGEAAGQYRIEVSPDEEDGAGRYYIVLRRVEPLATDPEQRVDQLMASYAGPNVPGGVVGVVRDGNLVFARAYGLANLSHGVPFTTETRTNLGSTSKQFTAFAITLLAQRGMLSLDDDVRIYIPEVPEFDHTVRVRHLLTHTSGYREFLNALAMTGRQLGEGDFIDRDELIRLVQRQPELQNEPGAEWNYNNTAYGFLALIVERVTGEDFPDWMRENVFMPLGMDDTRVRGHRTEVIPNSAQGYVPTEDGWREAIDLGGAIGAGTIYTTVDDMARWIRNFETGELGGHAVHEQMTTHFVLTDGDTTHYGFGLSIDEYRGLERVHHGGADAAHRAMMRYYPEIDAGVVVLSNNARFNSGAMSDDVTDAFFEQHLEPEEEDSPADPDAEYDPADFDPEDFDGLEGSYALDPMPSFILTFTRENGRYIGTATGQPPSEIVPTSDSTFRLTTVDASITFHRGPDGVADSLTLHQNGNHLARRVGADSWEPDAEELAEYTGRYFSEELETFYTLRMEDGELVMRHNRFPEDVTLTPSSERDEFTAGFPIAQMTFRRGENGEISGFEASNVRTRGVWFERIGAAPGS